MVFEERFISIDVESLYINVLRTPLLINANMDVLKRYLHKCWFKEKNHFFI